jgi:ketosteroid isomerase-like protein
MGPEQQNVDLVKQAYAAFGRGDLPGLLALLGDDIVWTTPGPADVPTAGERRGKAAVAEFFQAIAGIGDTSASSRGSSSRSTIASWSSARKPRA